MRAALALSLLVGCGQRLSGPDDRYRPAPPPSDDAIYLVMVDRFANGDAGNDDTIDLTDPAAFHGGDLAGVIAHLDDLAALGVRTIWLTPIFAMQTDKVDDWGAYHGYWVKDLRRLEPRFGDQRDLAKLRAELTKRDMRLVLDMVWNHTGYEADLRKLHPDWYHDLGDIEDWDDPIEAVTHDVHGLPDLAVERAEVADWLRRATEGWVEAAQPDGLRIDAVRHMPRTFLAAMNRDLRVFAGPGFWTVGEVFDGDPVRLADSREAAGFSAVFDFPLHYALIDVVCRDRELGRLGSTLSLDRVYGAAADGSGLVTFLDNHDVARVTTACGEDRGRVKQALGLLLTARGTPSLTWGTELGLTGAEEPANRADMAWGAPQPLAATIRDLLAARRAHPALQRGVTTVEELGSDHLVTLRSTADEAALIAWNRGSSPSPITVPEALAGVTWTAALRLGPDGDVTAAPAATPSTAAPGLTVWFAAPASPGGFGALAAAALAPTPRAVRFEVTGAPLGPGDALLVVGAGPELGHWDPTRGVGLDAEGVGTATLPQGAVIAFKLVILHPDGSITWQDGPDRSARIGASSPAVQVHWDT